MIINYDMNQITVQIIIIFVIDQYLNNLFFYQRLLTYSPNAI